MQHNLPSTEVSFSIDVIGEETSQEYKGQFTFKKLTIKEKIDKLERWISQKMIEATSQDPLPLPNEDQNAQAKSADSLYGWYRLMASLRFGIIECPNWWENSDYGLDLHDMNVVLFIVSKKKEAEDKWIEDVKSKANKVQITPEPATPLPKQNHASK